MRRNVALLSTMLCFVAAASVPAQTSGSPDLSTILQQIQQGGSATPAPSAPLPQTQVIQAPSPPPPVSPPSRVELIFSDRAGLPLHQFGYDVFAGLTQVTIPQVGTIQGYYVLGPGDELLINLRGQENASYDVVVGNDGNVVLPNLPPLPAAGHTFESFQSLVAAEVKKAYIATTAFVSVGQLRRVNVTVAGEVNAPGVKMLTGLSTPLDALILALGVKKSGSLRNIKILRGGEVIPYDLYHVLLSDGGSSSIRLADGDKILVPPTGNVVAVSGWVRRPGIYEMAPGESRISLPELLKLGGGVQVQGAFRYSLVATGKDGRQHVEPLEGPAGQSANDGDILFVERAVDERVGQFEYFGPTSLAGEYSVSRYGTLADLFAAPGVLGQAPYMLLGIISRKDRKTLQRSILIFSPKDIMEGRTNIALQSEDIVRVFDLVEAGMISNAVEVYARKIDYMDDKERASATADADASQTAAFNHQIDSSIFSHTDARAVDMLSPQASVGAQPESATLAAGANAPTETVPTTNPDTGEIIAPSEQANQRFLSQEQSAILKENRQLLSASAGPFMLDQRTSSQGNVPITSEAPNVATLALQIGVDPVVLISILADHRVTINGSVRAPGDFIVGSSVTLDELVDAAGGPVQWADMTNADLLRTVVDSQNGRAKTTKVKIDLRAQPLASIEVEPRDVFQFNPVFTDVDQGSVAVQGEVRFPGSFDLVRGERLSDLIRQSGGLTQQAYPYGAMFFRKATAREQRAGYQHTADDIEQQLVMSIAQGTGEDPSTSGGTASLDTAAFLQNLINQLRNAPAPGRLSIVADPAMLAADPQADLILQPGDFLYIPPRPSSVTVVGEVLSAGSYVYKSGLDVGDYVDLAGGYGRYADESYVFVVNPDGTSRSIEQSFFNFASDRVAPGSLIVVPRDLKPLDFERITVEVAKVVSDLAVSAASLSVLNRGT